MIKFKQYIDEKVLNEGKDKIAVFAFGRFNPPTKGHLKLIDKTIAVAKEKGGEHFIFPSQTTDKKKDPKKSKNPLNWDIKVNFMKTVFPHATIMKVPEAKTPHMVSEYLEKHGFTEVYFVVGSDRVEEFKTRWLPYAEEIFNGKTGIISAGSRDPDAEGVAGMSATKAREAAILDNIGKFRAATGWAGETAQKMMRAVREGMGVE